MQVCVCTQQPSSVHSKHKKTRCDVALVPHFHQGDKPDSVSGSCLRKHKKRRGDSPLRRAAENSRKGRSQCSCYPIECLRQPSFSSYHHLLEFSSDRRALYERLSRPGTKPRAGVRHQYHAATAPPSDKILDTTSLRTKIPMA